MKKLLIFVFVALSFFFVSTVSASSYGWGFNRNNNNKTPDIGKYQSIIEGTDSCYVGNTEDKVVYLTFDAGYDNGNIPKILEVLNEKNVYVTFFLTGDFLVREEGLVRLIDSYGHIIANHSWSHKNIANLSKIELTNEVLKFENKIEQILQKQTVKFFRPPAGNFNRDSLMQLKEMGYKTFFWSIAYKDWINGETKSRENPTDHIIRNIHNGAIILLHSVSNDNLEALPDIIDNIKAKGYEIQNLDAIKSSGN